MRALVILAIMAVPRFAVADFENNEAIHAHVDAIVAAGANPGSAATLFANRWTLSLGALIPIYGSYELDHEVFGGVRPAAVAFDWIAGGIVPLGLGLTAWASEGSLSSRSRSILAWTALGLYASTRIGVLVIGNLHITEFNRYLQVRLGVAESPGGQVAPALIALARW